MLHFSELSLPQKKLINEMRQGHILMRSKLTDSYYLLDGRFTISVRCNTASTLIKRAFIKQCFENENIEQFCVNVEIDYGKYLDEYNNLRWC